MLELIFHLFVLLPAYSFVTENKRCSRSRRIVFPIILIAFSAALRIFLFHENLAPNHFQLLEVTRKSSQSDIRSSYRSLSKLYHPDKNPDYKDHFIKLTLANEVLKDSVRREFYDNYHLQEVPKELAQLGDEDRRNARSGMPQNYTSLIEYGAGFFLMALFVPKKRRTGKIAVSVVCAASAVFEVISKLGRVPPHLSPVEMIFVRLTVKEFFDLWRLVLPFVLHVTVVIGDSLRNLETEKTAREEQQEKDLKDEERMNEVRHSCPMSV